MVLFIPNNHTQEKKVHIFGVLLFFPDETLHRRKTLVRNAVMNQYIYHYAPQMTFQVFAAWTDLRKYKI